MAAPLNVLRYEHLYLCLNVGLQLHEGLLIFLMKAKLAEPLVCIEDTGKVQNRRTTKSRIVHLLPILILIILILNTFELLSTYLHVHTF